LPSPCAEAAAIARQLHLPAHWHNMNFSGVLPKGTPVANNSLAKKSRRQIFVGLARKKRRRMIRPDIDAFLRITLQLIYCVQRTQR
ncbi:MAG: hypothetical protein ACXU80_17885, partial [Xanthobacteraceae bacterium]